MAKILHISDIHLESELQGFGDDKVGLPGLKTGKEQKLDFIRKTCGLLLQKIKTEVIKFDAIVVSGDITTRNSPKGFIDFLEVFEELFDFVGNRNVVVIPGNHDVDWEIKPSDNKKYLDFFTNIRKKGFLLPFLDGLSDIDYNPSRIINTESGISIDFLAINSSNYCGFIPDFYQEILEKLVESSNLPEEIKKTAKRKFTFDAARISDEQFEILKNWKSAANYRIATLHHQLLPISDYEEVKPFENFTNLYKIRKMISNLGIDLVLHGHKHVKGNYFDFLGTNGVFHVISSPHCTAQIPPNGFYFGSVINLKKVTSDLKFYSNSDLIIANQNLIEVNSKNHIWDRSGSDYEKGHVYAETVNEAYDKIFNLFKYNEKSKIYDIYIKIKSLSDFDLENMDFDNLNPENLPERIKNLAIWWQNIDSSNNFLNHRKRMEKNNQTQKVIDSISDNYQTNDAIIGFLDPDLDELIYGSGPNLISPISFHVYILENSDGSRSINLHANYKSQLFGYWWLTNVYEVYIFLKEIRDSLNQMPKRAGWRGNYILGEVSLHCLNMDLDAKTSNHGISKLNYLPFDRLKDVFYEIFRSSDSQKELLELFFPKWFDPNEHGTFIPYHMNPEGVDRVVSEFAKGRKLKDIKEIFRKIREISNRYLSSRLEFQSDTRRVSNKNLFEESKIEIDELWRIIK
jgi:3',5'-cyclic AMP phosphodiesterase CpdA